MMTGVVSRVLGARRGVAEVLGAALVVILLAGCSATPSVKGADSPTSSPAVSPNRLVDVDPTAAPQVGAGGPVRAAEQGIVIRVDDGKGLGFIRADEGAALAFHLRDVDSPEAPVAGDRVTFDLIPGNGAPQVVNLRIVD